MDHNGSHQSHPVKTSSFLFVYVVFYPQHTHTHIHTHTHERLSSISLSLYSPCYLYFFSYKHTYVELARYWPLYPHFSRVSCGTFLFHINRHEYIYLCGWLAFPVKPDSSSNSSFFPFPTDTYQAQVQAAWQKSWNQTQSLLQNLRFRERGPLKSWRPETMAEAIHAVLKEGLSLSQVSVALQWSWGDLLY